MIQPTDEEQIEQINHELAGRQLPMPKQIGDDVRGAFDVLQRLYAKALAKGIQPDDKRCPKGCTNGWIVYDKGDQVHVEPCPDHKPNERRAYEQGAFDSDYFKDREQDKDDHAKKTRVQKEKEQNEWW